RLGRAPQQLIADRKRAEVLAAHRQLAEAADRNRQRPGDGRWRQLAQRGFLVVRHDRRPLVRRCEQRLDLLQRYVAAKFDREPLAVAAHRADADAEAVDRNLIVRAAQNLIALGLRLPFFLALAVAEILVDPWQQ